MKTKIVLLFFLFHSTFYAQNPNWSVQNNFEYVMTLIGFVSVDNVILSNENDQVAAFVNGEIRGVTNLTYVASENAFFAYLTIYSNVNGENVEFKIYDSTNNSVVDAQSTLTFETLSHHGNLLQPFSIASPALSNETQILNLDFQEVNVINYHQNDNIITVNIFAASQSSLENSTIVFELSPGAEMIYDNQFLTSGVSMLDLGTSLSFEVKIRSEDRSVIRNVTLQINFEEANSGISRFFRRNEVCHTLGAIKVFHNVNGANVILKKNNITMVEDTINNSEVIFDNLQAGDYEVVIVGSPSIIKNIKINND